MKRQRIIPLLAYTTMLLCYLLIPRDVHGEDNAILQTKTFLEHPPAINDITFSILSKGMGDTNGFSIDGKLYTAGVQDQDFVMAELKTPDQVPQMSTKTLPIAGKLGSFRWSMLGMTLNLGQTNGVAEPQDPAVTLSKELETILDEPMNLGIYHAERGSLHVTESGEFSGPIAKRLFPWAGKAEIRGRFTLSTDGQRLESSTWQITTKPEMIFHINYSYQNNQSNFFPSGWECWATRSGQNLNTNRISIFRFQLASGALPDEYFRPERFITKTNLPPIGPIILTQSNGNTLWFRDGKFQVTKVEEPVQETSTRRNIWVVRILLIGFTLGGLVILIRSAFVSAKQRKGK
jgi:hypothetical protein